MRRAMTAAMCAAMMVGAAHAQESATFTLTGPITAENACSMSLGNGGVVDLGDIDIDALSQTQETLMTLQTMPVSITCTTPTRIAVEVADNRMDTPLPNIGVDDFGLGLAPNGHAIGRYHLVTQNGMLNGAAMPVVHTLEAPGASTWDGFGATDYWHKANGSAPEWRALGPGDGIPPALESGSFDIVVEILISSREDLDFGGVMVIDGSATLNLIYL